MSKTREMSRSPAHFARWLSSRALRIDIAPAARYECLLTTCYSQAINKRANPMYSRNDFNWGYKLLRVCFWVLFHYCTQQGIGLKTSGNFLNLSKVFSRLPLAACVYLGSWLVQGIFSVACGWLHAAFTSDLDWFRGFSLLLVIGWGDYFGFTALSWKPLTVKLFQFYVM